MANQRTVAMHKLPINPLARAILPQAGPNRHVIQADDAETRRILVAIHIGVQAHRRAASPPALEKGRAKTSQPLVMIAMSRPLHATMKLPSDAGGDIWIGARIGIRIHKKFIADRRAVVLIQPGIDVHARQGNL